MQYHWPTEGVCGPGIVSTGSLKWLNMYTLYHRLQFLLKQQGKSLKGLLLRIGCHFFSTWHYLKHSSICAIGQVVKINNIYTFVEEGDIDIVRMLDVYQAKGYLYCTLYFFTRIKITTVSQILNHDDYTIQRIMENEEYDEIMSRRLWSEVDKQDNLYEFGY